MNHPDLSYSDAPSSFDQLLEFAPDAIIGVDTDGRIVLTNQQTERLFGYDRGALTGEPIERLVPERFRGRHRGHRDGYFRDPQTRAMGDQQALFGLRRDGSEFPAEISLSSMVIPSGRIALVAVRDVTDRLEAEQAQARLAAIVNSSGDAIVGFQTDGTITSWNRAATALYGYAANDAIGRSLLLLGDPRVGGAPAFDDELTEHEATHRRHDGSTIDVLVTISEVVDARREHVGMAMIARDISAQRRAERTFQALLEFAPDGFVGVGRDGLITLANRQTEALFGYDRQELIGAPVERLLPTDKQHGHQALRESYFKNPQVRAMGAGIELAGRRKDGSTFPAEISLSSLETATGVIAIAAVRDISDRAESARERQLREELEHTRRMESVGQLAGGIAHDFNNLLGVIMNLAAFVEAELPEGSPTRQDVVDIRAAATRAAAVTRQLLIFSRREVVQPEVIELDALLLGLMNLLERALGERITLEMSPAANLWAVEADRGQLEQVLVNLAVNARDAMPDGGRLLVTTSNVVLDEHFSSAHAGIEAGRYVRLTVSDTGVGMSPETAERAFDPFFTTKPKGQGTGLGLATVYGIVKRAGGHVMLYSEPGIGTAVKIHLPATAKSPTDQASAPAAATSGGGEVILLAEDEPTVRRVVERMLERAGYAVLSAQDVDDALELVKRHDVDLLLTDVVMPGMVGPELAARMRETQPSLRVLFTSGYSHELLTPDSLDAQPGTAFLEKPFASNALLQMVRDLLDAPDPPDA